MPTHVATRVAMFNVGSAMLLVGTLTLLGVSVPAALLIAGAAYVAGGLL
jgi:hypothetical protein